MRQGAVFGGVAGLLGGCPIVHECFFFYRPRGRA
jgi:hypothetical protein